MSNWQVGQVGFAGSAHGYLVKILEVHEVTSSVLVHYDGYHSMYDSWLPMGKIQAPSDKRNRKQHAAKCRVPAPRQQRREGHAEADSKLTAAHTRSRRHRRCL